MKQVTKTIFVCGMALICYTGGDTTLFAQTKMINQVDFSQVRIQDDFWSPRLKKHVTNTLPVCIDQIENKTGRIRNFENAAKNQESIQVFFMMIRMFIKLWKALPTR